MARVECIAPGHWKDEGRCIEVDGDGRISIQDQCEDWPDHFVREEESLKALPQDRIWATPVADGQAMYLVTSEKPLLLRRIPYMDKWQAPLPLIRGLRLSDVQVYFQWNARMTGIFSKPR